MNPKAPSVSEDHINALHDSLSYETMRFPNTTSTVATARLPGGFVVAIGHSACVSPANFNAEMGVKFAISDAAKKAKDALWAFEGYALSRQLNQAGSSQVHPDSGLPSTPAVEVNTDRAQLAALGEQSGQPEPYADLPPHQRRVIEEQDALNDKIVKLRAFLNTPMFAHLHDHEQIRLSRQVHAMQIYASILAERVAAF